MLKANTPPEARLLIRAVQEAEHEPGRRLNLTDVALDDDVKNIAPIAKSWVDSGFGTQKTVKTAVGGTYLAFTFSEEGFARAREEAERLRKQYRAAWGFKRPRFSGASTWLAWGIAAIALIYQILI